MGGVVSDIGNAVGDVVGGVVGGVKDVVSNAVDTGVGLINDIPVVGNIADNVLGLDPNGGGIVPIVKDVGTAAALSGLGSAVGGLLTGSTAVGAGAAADASFIAADAAQLAAQGIGESQIGEILASSGVSSGAASLAASMATNGVSEGLMTDQLTNLSSNTGLLTQSSDANAVAEIGQADASQLAAQTNNNVAAIEQNLVAAGYDPLEAASMAQNAVLASSSPTVDMYKKFSDYMQQNPSVANKLAGVQQAPTTTTTAQPVTTNVIQQQPQDGGFYVPFGGTGLENPFARSAKERQSLVGSIFGF